MTLASKARGKSAPARWRYVVGGSLTFGPVAVLTFSPLRAVTALVLLAVLGALNAAMIGRREVALAGTATTLVAFASVLLSAAGPALPVLGAVWVAMLGLLTAAVASRGLSPVGVVAIGLAAHVLIDPRGLVAGYGAGSIWSTAVLVGATVLSASGWVLLITWGFLPGERSGAPVARSASYGVLLASVCGAFTFVALVCVRDTNAWWSVLTVALVLQPDARVTRSRAVGRVVGTLVGGAVTAAAALTVGSGVAVMWLGTVSALACILLVIVRAPYWMYTTAVTVAVLLLTVTPSEILGGDVRRLVATAVAAAVSAVAVLALPRSGAPRAREHADTG